MNPLLVLLSIMTFTVENKNTVSVDGDGVLPYNMEVVYDCSYQKGQVRAGDVATLTLGELGGIVVEKIEVSVRSNKEAGAGTFTVQANGETVSTKSGTLMNWIGKYDKEYYHPISLLTSSVQNVQTLTIQLTGTTSSLFIEKYEITYGNGPARTVTLMKGDELYETIEEDASGQGILLPTLASLDHWQFVGWTKTKYEQEVAELSSLYPSGTKFYPGEDMTLWAVYEYQAEPHVYETELVSGEYLYVNTYDQKAMTGVPENGKMGVLLANIENPNQWYTVTFNTQRDSATIDYTATNIHIGFSGIKLVEKRTPFWWAVFHEGEKTAFYTTINGKTYMIYPGYDSGDGEYTGLVQVNDVTQTPTALRSAIPETQKTRYSCFPERLEPIENTEAETHEIMVPFGIYEMHIQNGHKRLKIR